MEQLVSQSAARAEKLWGAVFPRVHLANRIFVQVGNAVRRMTGNDFRSYIHSTDAIDAVLRRQGFELRSAKDTYVWRAAVYSRPVSA
jgi:hypothetical protein